MKIQMYIYGLLTAVLGCGMSGCALRDDDLMAEAMRIQLGAEVTSSVLSRVSPNVDYDVPQSLPITLVRWDENQGDDMYGKTELSATMGTPATDGTWLREIVFDTPQFYNNKVGDVGFAGWYPASDDAGWVKTDGKVIDSNHTMTYKLDGTTDVMVSDFARGNFQSGMPALKFHHALSMYKIYVYAVDDGCKQTWGELTQVTLSNLHHQLKVQLPATFTGDWEPQYSFSTPQPESGSPTYRSYSLLNDGVPQELPVGMSKALEVGTLLHGKPAGGGSFTEGVLYIEAKTAIQSEGVKVAIIRDFKPGYAYNIYLKFSEKGIINADVSATDWTYDSNEYEVTQDFGLLTDLSRYGTANCYIVSSANRGYCFDATVKGNGVNTLTKRDGTVIQLPDRDVHLDIDTVAILRSDAMMKLDENGKMQPITDYKERVKTPIVELLSNKLTDGKIVFRVPGNTANSSDYRLIYRGNVKIGAYKNGKIVWSWHIWVTDKPQNQGYSNGYVALDRNLGAVTDNYNTFQPVHSAWSGLYYQWGRKDPIFRPTVDERPEWADIWPPKKENRVVSVAEAHEKPTTYFWSSTSNDWTTDTENSDYFWGYISVRDDVKKTLYDPCPPGYRVPGNALWENPTDAMTDEKVSNGSTFAGYLFTIRDMIDIYYPAAACLAEGELFTCDHSGNNHDETHEYTYLYSATPYDPLLYGQTDSKYKGLAYHFRYNENSGASSPVLVADPDQYHVKRSAAYPVRCVFENSAPTVTDLSEVQAANSYVVSKSGFYKFRATTRGNGVTGLYVVSNGTLVYRSFDATMGAGISDIDKIDLLWWQGDLSADSNYKTFANGSPSSDQVAAKCPVAILDNGKLEDGFATFYVTVDETTYGNVGLAAYDANGEILWSWHIWIQPEVKVVRLGDYTVMDRNLGATYAPANENYDSDNFYANLGLYYQWGRKDPFFPPKGKDNTDNSTDVWFKKENGVWKKQTQNSVSTKNLIPQSVKHPLEFYSSGNSLWQTSFLTLDAEPNDLWGYVGSAGTPGESFAKTMYDPCPPGYRVMQHDVFESANICNANDGTSFTFYHGIYDKNGIYFKDGLQTSKGTISAGGVWFPNARAINNTGVFVNGNYRLSTATPYYYPGGKDQWGNYIPPYVNCREMRWTNSSIKQDESSWMAAARVVRCQME